MFHEPFLGQLPFSIDLCYFARWLRDGSERQPAVPEPPPDDNQGLITPPRSLKEPSQARLLVDSAVSEIRMF